MDSDPTDSDWFMNFMDGLCSRIGRRRKQDAVIYILLIIEIQRLLKLECQLAVTKNDKECIITVDENGSFQIFSYYGSLIGYETPKVLLRYLHHHHLSPE